MRSNTVGTFTIGRRAAITAAALATAALVTAGCSSSTDTATTTTSAAASSSGTKAPTTTAKTSGTTPGSTPKGTTPKGTTPGGTAVDQLNADITPDEVAADVTWGLNAEEFQGRDGLLVAYDCTPDGAPSTVWGDATYTDDSSVCTAAVHEGLIDFADGGRVVIEIAPGLEEYGASTANGVTTFAYASWPGSFVFPGN